MNAKLIDRFRQRNGNSQPVSPRSPPLTAFQERSLNRRLMGFRQVLKCGASQVPLYNPPPPFRQVSRNKGKKRYFAAFISAFQKLAQNRRFVILQHSPSPIIEEIAAQTTESTVLQPY